jgi:hypothetical protein
MSGARKAAAAAPVAALPDASVDVEASVGGSDERDDDAGSAVASSAPEERSIGGGYGGFVERTRGARLQE